MAYSTANISAIVADDAAFTAWGSGISALLTAVGVSKTSDTGQVSWASTVTRPAGSTLPYYEIRKLSDPLSGASPVYLKVSYGSTTSVSRAGISFQVGTGSDGSGTLTGLTSVIADTYTSDTGSSLSWAASDGHGFVFSYAISSTKRYVIAVDRQRRPDGVAAPVAGQPNTGFMRAWCQPSVSSSYVTIDPVAAAVNNGGSRLAIPTGIAVTSATSFVADEGSARTFPLWIVTLQGSYASKMLIGVPMSDFPAGMEFPVAHLGASRTYVSMGSQFPNYDAHGNTGMSIALWKED